MLVYFISKKLRFQKTDLISYTEQLKPDCLYGLTQTLFHIVWSSRIRTLGTTTESVELTPTSGPLEAVCLAQSSPHQDH